MTDASITLGIDGRPAEQGARVVNSALGSVKKEAGATVGAVDKTTGAFDKLKQASFGLRGAFAGLVAAMSVERVIKYADTWKLIQGRLEAATGSTVRAAQAQRDLYAISQQNRSSFEANATLYTRLAAQADQLGLSHKRLTGIVTTVSQSFKVSGADAQSSAAAIRQLGQALGSGVLRGDEFNSIMENAPRLQKALAAEITGGSVGALRLLAEQGKLTADEVIKAMERQSKTIAEEAARMPLTVQDALVKVDNAFMRFIGQSASVAAGTSSLALALSSLADNFDVVANAATAVGIALSANYIGSLVTAQAATTTFAGVMAATGKAMAAAFPVAAVAASVYLLLNYFDEIKAGIAVVGTSVAVGFVAMGEYVAGFGRGMIRALTTAFDEAKRIAGTFARDLGRLVSDPLGFLKTGFSSPDFSGAGGRISGAFSAEWEKAGQAARNYGNEFKGILDDTLQGYRSQKDGVSSVIAETEKYNQQMDKIVEQIGKGEAAVNKTGKAHKDATKAVKEASAATDVLAERADEAAQIFRDTATGIQQSFSRAFRDVLDGRNGVKGLVTGIQSAFKDMLSNLLTLAIARPIIVPIVASIGGALGLGSDTIAGVTGQLGGGAGGIGNALSIGSTLMKLKSGLTEPLLNGLFGKEILFGSPTLSSGLQAFTGGSALAGFGGNLLANALFGNRGMGASIGGAIGGIGGTFAGGALLGTALGSAAGPVGALAGAFLGNIVGGLFGGKPSSGLQSGSVDIATGGILGRGGLTGKKFNQANFDTVTSLAQLVGGLGQVFGATGSIQLAAGNRNGLEYAMTGDKSIFDADSPLRKSFKTANELVKSLTQDFANQAGENLSESLRIAMKNIDYGKTQEELTKAMQDLVFAAGFDKLGQDSAPVAQAKLQLDEINKTFDTMAETAKRLGLSEQKVADERKRQIDLLRAGVNQSSLNSLYELTDPAGLARSQEQARFAAQLREVQAVNGNVEAVYALHRINMLRIQEQYDREEAQTRIQSLQAEAQKADALVESYGRIAKNLESAAYGMRIGGLSTLSPLAKYQASGAMFEDTLQKALSGNADAMEQLPSLGQQFLELSQAYNSSNEIFARDFDAVQKGLESARALAVNQVDIQKSIAAASWKQVETMEKGLNAVQQAIAALGGLGKVGGIDAFTGGAANAAGRNLSEMTASGLTVGQIESAGRALLGGYTGASGGGEISRMLSERGLNDAFAATLRSMGARGYDIGGMPYSSPFIVGEKQPEVIADRRSAMVIPFQQNAAILREMEGMNRQMRAQTRILQEGMQQQIKATQEVGENTSRLADDASLQKRKRN